MAKNREPVKHVSPGSESGEGEDEETSSDEVGSHESDSEPERTQVAKKPSSSTPATLKKTQPQSSSKPPQQQKEPSSSSDEEESGSESESESDGPNPNVKPIASKPMDNPQISNDGARKPKSKPSASELVTPTKSASGKRLAEEKGTEVKDAKKAKKKAEIEDSGKKTNDDSKKLLFQRLWSEDDEIVVLEGMIDYAAKKKSDPVTDLNAFHDFIRKNLHVDVTRTQLQDKIRRLKKKYENNKSKEKEGKDKTFSKPHEQKAYELSKKIWGNDSGKENGVDKVLGSPKTDGSAARKNSVRSVTEAENEEPKDVKTTAVVSGGVGSSLPATRVNPVGLNLEERILMTGAELFEGGKGLEGEQEWKKLKIEEMEAYMRQLELRIVQTKLVLDALKSRHH